MLIQKQPLMFQSAEQTKVFQDVVEQNQQAILDDRLKTGDTLLAEWELKQLFDQAQTCVEHGSFQRNAFIEIDKKIHMTLADITGNPIYSSVLHSIHDNIHRYYDRFLSMEKRELQENLQDLCDLIQAVENRNADQAQKIAQNHVKRFNRYMKKRERAEKVPKV